jgi:hypothetical protein
MIKELRIGTLNVLTLYKGGAMRNLDKVLQGYRMDITGIEEIRWLGQGILERRDCNVCYICQENKHDFGVDS